MSEEISSNTNRVGCDRPDACQTGRSLGDIAEQALNYVSAVVAQGGDDFPDLSEIEDCVSIKNADGVLVYSNEAHHRAFSPGASPIGRTCQSLLDPKLSACSKVLSELILDGCPFVECEHSGPGPDGSIYRMVTHKRSLQSLRAPGMAILSVVRLLERDERASGTKRLDLTTSAAQYRDLTERDQEICRLTALGISSRELGERLGMTTRGIELRKQKAFAKLGVAKAVDLARLLTRLQDHGHLDLGL